MKRRRGAKALGLSILAALGLMAFGAGGAQAQDWLIGGKAMTGLTSSETITGTLENEENYLLILNLNLKIACKTGILKEAHILPGGSGRGILAFSNCHVLDSVKAKADCEFVEPILASTKWQVVLHEGNPYVLFVPQDLLTFAVVEQIKVECPLPDVAALKGSFLTKVVKNNANPMLLSSKEALGLLGHELRYGNNLSHLGIDINLSLAGKYSSQTLGAH